MLSTYKYYLCQGVDSQFFFLLFPQCDLNILFSSCWAFSTCFFHHMFDNIVQGEGFVSQDHQEDKLLVSRFVCRGKSCGGDLGLFRRYPANSAIAKISNISELFKSLSLFCCAGIICKSFGSHTHRTRLHKFSRTHSGSHFHENPYNLIPPPPSLSVCLI